MFSSVRKTLVDSHVAAATIAILLFLSLEGFYVAAFQIVRFLVNFFELAANHQSSNNLGQFEFADPWMWTVAMEGIVSVLAIVVSAWLLSHWVYGVNPLRSLASYRHRLSRKSHA